MFTRFSIKHHALWELLRSSEKFVPVGMSGTVELDRGALRWELEVNRIPRRLWPELNAAVKELFREARTIDGDKDVVFDERHFADLEQLGFP